jgi:DNA-binding GntR family transcriptional regulator
VGRIASSKNLTIGFTNLIYQCTMNNVKDQQREPRGSLSERVYQHLVDGIVRGEIKYGDSLNIKEIAARLAVSPMPIRDAVKKLETEGIVVVKPRSSCLVRTPTRRDVVQSVEARRMIELYVVSSIYRTVTARDLEPIERLLDEMRADIGILSSEAVTGTADEAGAADETDAADKTGAAGAARDRYIARDREFHTVLCGLMNNAFVDKFYREISLHLNMRFRHDVGRRDALQQTFRDHEAIVGDLRRNSRDVIATMEAHLDRSRENITNGELFRTLPEE